MFSKAFFSRGVKICGCVGKSQPITRRQNFGLDRSERNCRRYFKVHLECKISAVQGRKHCEKRRNCLLLAISPFLKMFSTAIFFNPLADDKF